MPSRNVSRRRLLAASGAALAGLAGCLSGDSRSTADPPSSTSSPSRTNTRTGPTPADACGTPVGDEFDAVDATPSVPPCPAKPDALHPCAVRAYVLGLEKHRRYRRAIDRYGSLRSLEFGVYDATVHRTGTGSGILVHADLFFAGTAATGTPPGTGTPAPVHFDDPYAASYLVTPEGQWRAVDRSGNVPASRNPRADGTAVDCETTPSTDRTAGTDVADGTVRVADVSVADFLTYALSGTHPHVHRRAGTQYVVVRADGSAPPESVRDRLTLELDGEAVPLAERQPVPWDNETVDLAFAVPKGPTIASGRVLVDGSERLELPRATIERVNTPPLFEVSTPSASPAEVGAGERTDATVRFGLANTGEGAGTFGASLEGNALSGARTVTATLSPGAERAVRASTRIVGTGEEATVRLDWGSGEWTTGIPVVGTPTAE